MLLACAPHRPLHPYPATLPSPPLPERRPTLKWTFGYSKGTPAAFVWQWIGSALLFLFPAVTYTLQARGGPGGV